jgi:hypothetical protein
MNKDFNTMKTNVGTRIQDTSAAMATIIGTFLNKRYFQVLRAINWQNVDYDYTFTTVSGTQNYALPDDFGKEISVRDTTTGVELARVDYQDLVTTYPDEVTDSGSPARYVIYEDVVKAQPTSSSALAIASSSTADTTQTILIRGITGGVETTESVTLTGTTTANSTNSYTRIKGISKSATTTGSVTITSNSAAVTLSVMAPKVTESRYKLMKLHYVPTTSLVISVPYIIKPMPMTEVNDYPCLDIADLLEIGAESDAWFYKRQGSKAVGKDTMFNIELQQYIFDRENQPNMVITFKPVTYNRDSLY